MSITFVRYMHAVQQALHDAILAQRQCVNKEFEQDFQQTLASRSATPAATSAQQLEHGTVSVPVQSYILLESSCYLPLPKPLPSPPLVITDMVAQYDVHTIRDADTGSEIVVSSSTPNARRRLIRCTFNVLPTDVPRSWQLSESGSSQRSACCHGTRHSVEPSLGEACYYQSVYSVPPFSIPPNKRKELPSFIPGKLHV